MMKYGWIIILLLINQQVVAQALPIVLDGFYDDWNTSNFNYTDNTNDGGAIDFYDMSVTNDEDFLYVRFRLNMELDLTDNNVITLHLDTDNNTSTGSFVHGIGTDLRVNFGFRSANLYHPSIVTGDFNDIDFRVNPTVTGDQFEIAISRTATVQGNPVFSNSDTIKVALKDNSTNGDVMPDVGTSFTYVMDNTPTAISPIDFEVDVVDGLRLMTYNMENDGLTDANRRPSFDRIIQAVDPDILTFNEGWNIPVTSAINYMNLILPQVSTWYGYKTGGVITLSKFPMLDNWNIFNSRVNGSLIDVSSANFGHDSILIINAHLKCCDGDALRQEQADRFVEFILDAKSAGGQVTLSDRTPFVLMGDLNLVGQAQQLRTLLTGNIINTNIYGQGGALDWDDSDLGDAVPRHSDGRMTYTWRNDGSSFPPGRIDYLIYSDEVLTIDKTFVVRTENMSASRLYDYGLNQNDTETASDHYPVVADFVYSTSTNTNPILQPTNFKIYPNPASAYFSIALKDIKASMIHVRLTNLLGQTVRTWENLETQSNLNFDIKGLESGIYNVIIESKEGRSVKQVMVR